MTDDQFKEIISKLTQLVRLTASSLTADKKQDEKIQILSQAGFQPKDIADLLDTTPNTVRVSLSRMRSVKKVVK